MAVRRVQLDLGPVDIETYTCNTDTDCREPAGISAYPSSPAVIGAAAWLPEEAPAVAAYLAKAGLTNAQISTLLVYGEENMADAAETAENFLRTEQELWTSCPRRRRRARTGQPWLGESR